MIIISKSNEKIKYINSLKEKKYREKHNCYVLEGIKVIDEHTSLEEQDSPELVVLCKEILFKAKGGEHIYSVIKKLVDDGTLTWDKNLLEVDKNVFEYISDTETPQGILMVLKKKQMNIETLLESANKEENFIILDGVSDAGNMGTIIRSAVAFGINNILCTKGCVDVYSPKVIRSAMGAIEKVNIFNMDKMNEDDILKGLSDHGYILCGTDLSAKKYLNEIKPNNKWIFVLGNEANGVSDKYKAFCNEKIKIPMEPVQESLNVAVAAAILMYNGYVGGVKVAAKLEINFANLKHNIDRINEKLYENQELLIMVKADAYGAGLVEVTKFLEEQGIKNFGVAYLKEAKVLRQQGIKGKIIVFSGLLPNEIDEAVKLDAVYSVSSIEMLEALNNNASGRKIKVELAIDTGMTRFGFDSTDIETLASRLKTFENICVDGVYTHFSSADVKEKENITLAQIKLFEECIAAIEKEGIQIPNKHMCNSAGILRYNSEKYNVVRLGISAYGYYADDSMKQEVDLKPIFKLTAPVCNIRTVGIGRKVSYNGTYETNKETKIAVLQIGYADGLSRVLSNKLKVNINGFEVPEIGNICMDTCMVDVTGIDVKVGDEAVIFDYECDKLEEIARLTSTIHYEVITNIGKRVDREYVK